MKKDFMRLCAILIALLLAAACFACKGKDAENAGNETDGVQQDGSYYPAADGFAGGSGTAEDPYQIGTAAQLAYLSRVMMRSEPDAFTYAACCYILTADVEINPSKGYASWGETPPEYEWRPIGTNVEFCGVFDGNGHTISGLYLRCDAGNSVHYAGLFSKLRNAAVRNLKVDRSYIRGEEAHDGIGGLAGNAFGSEFTNCAFDGTLAIEGYTFGGGVVGWAQQSTIGDCTFGGTILAGQTSVAGGIAGTTPGTNVSGCSSKGTLSTGERNASYVGGVIGSCSPDRETVVENCRNDSAIEAAEASAVGGVIGCISVSKGMDFSTEPVTLYGTHLTVKNCENNGTVTVGKLNYPVGGVVGLLMNTETGTEYGGNSCILSGCRNSGEIRSENDSAAGIVGEVSSNCAWTLENCVNEGTIHAEKGAAGIAGFVAASEQSSRITGCENRGAIETASSQAGGIVWKTFLWSLTVPEGQSADLNIGNCKNTGAIHSSGSGVSGMGGILGCTEANTATVFVESCVNEGDVTAEDSCRIGGIVGNTYFDNTQGYADASVVIQRCVNRGTLRQGDGTVAFDRNVSGRSDLSGVDTEQYVNGDTVMFVLGGSCVGGIAGFVKCAVIEDCVDLGAIRVGSNAIIPVSEVDLIAAAVSDGEGKVVFCGGVTGLYFYLDSSATAENTRVTGNAYPDDMPAGAYFPFGDSGMASYTDNTPLPADALEARAAETVQ